MGENTGPIVGRHGEAAVLITSQHQVHIGCVPMRHPELHLCHAACLKASGKSLLALFHGHVLFDANAARPLLSLAQPGPHGRHQPVSAVRVYRRGGGIAILLGSFLLLYLISCITAGNTSGL